jgi:hypothetical protein
MRNSVVLLVVLLLARVDGSARAQSAGSAAAPSELNSQAFHAKADFFPVVAWDRQDAWRKFDPSAEACLRDAADCQFNVVGFIRPEDLPVCEKLGLSAIVAPSAPAGAKAWFRDWKALGDDDIDQGVRSMVEQAAGSKAVFGYTIMDEPGTPAFPKLARAVAAVNKYAPGKLAHINLYPNYATLGAADKSQLGAATYTEYLERFVGEVRPQFLCYDNYMVAFSDDLQDAAKGALYFTNLLEVRRVAEKHGLPFWNVVCCNQIRPATVVPSPANLALQAYTTLAAGGRGLTWFKYQQGGYAYAPVNNSGRKTETWRYLQLVNRQVRTLGPLLNRLHSTGVYFAAPAPDKSLSENRRGLSSFVESSEQKGSVPLSADGSRIGSQSLPLLPGRVVTAVRATSSVRGLGTATPSIMVGEFTDGKQADYVMLVNLSLQRSANIKLDTAKDYKSRQVVSAEDGSLSPLDAERGHWLTPGQGVLIRLE